jgi:hypothetical protein
MSEIVKQLSQQVLGYIYIITYLDKNVDCPDRMQSEAPKRLNIQSIGVSRPFSAGTYNSLFETK